MYSHTRMFSMGALSLAVLAALSALSACGGGGGGGAVAPAATTVSGTAAKGIVKQARVLVCRIVNGVPEADATCAAGTTAADGSFSVAMSDGYTGPAIVKILAATGSMMSDEITGTDLPYNMTLRACVPAVSATTAVYVTPFSEMAANAVGASVIDAARINLAMTTVQTLMADFGIDLTVKPMIDLRSSDTALLTRQSNMVKQLARVNLAARTMATLRDGSGVACNALTTPDQQIACATGAMARVMTGPASSDAAAMTTLRAALSAQNPTSVTMPIISANGTLAMEMADLTSYTSMQNAMQRAGMTSNAAASTAQGMMQGMH